MDFATVIIYAKIITVNLENEAYNYVQISPRYRRKIG